MHYGSPNTAYKGNAKDAAGHFGIAAVKDHSGGTMFISMQGNWTITVKSMESDNPRRFIVSGAASGNGTYNATVGMDAVNVTGDVWTIATQYNSGAGFQQSDTRLKFPVKQGGNYKFDIESNDDPSFVDFDDLILTCSTPAASDTYLVYGN